MKTSADNKVNYFQNVQKVFTQHMCDPDNDEAGFIELNSVSIKLIEERSNNTIQAGRGIL